MFQPQSILFSELPIESALTEYHRAMTQNPVQDPIYIDPAENFQSSNGPYTYENGSLKQPNTQLIHDVSKQEDPEQGKIRMDQEYYQLEVVFEVAATSHNFERGNIFVQSKFESYKKGMKPLVVSRTGYLDPQSSFKLMVRDITSMIPFCTTLFGCPDTQFITIKIFEKFDNDDFGLEKIEFLVPNDTLQFKHAHINVKTALYGVRYLMHDWFFTCAAIVISVLTISISTGVMLGVVAMK